MHLTIKDSKFFEKLDKLTLEDIVWWKEIHERIYFINKKGQLFAFGLNKYGELGIGSKKVIAEPAEIYLPEKIKDIQGSAVQTIFLLVSGRVYVCGKNDLTELKNVKGNIYAPRCKGSLNDIKHLASGFSHSLALNSQGSLFLWGVGEHGQLGNNSIDVISKPITLHFFSQKKLLKLRACSLVVLQNVIMVSIMVGA